MIVGPGPDPGTVRKEAGTAGEHDRLAHEAEVLAAAPHPGVVELLAVERRGRGRSVGALVLRTVGGGSLAGVGGMPASEVCAIGAAVVTVLADLHDIGVVHGGVDASHVLLDGDGRRSVLCSLGRGRCPGQPDGPTPADDVAAAGAMLAALLGSSEPHVAGPLMKVLARARHPRPSRRPSARRLAGLLTGLAGATPLPAPAALLTGLAGAARLPAPAAVLMGLAGATPLPAPAGRRTVSSPAPAWPSGAGADAVADSGVPASRTRRRKRARPLVLSGAVTTLATMGLMTATTLAKSGCPDVAARCRPLSQSGGVIDTARGRFRVGGPGDQVVLGRWQCTPDPRPALLRTATGEIWTFDRWAEPGRTVTGRLVAKVGGASSLRVAASSSMCDRLVVLRHRGRPLTLDVPPSP